MKKVLLVLAVAVLSFISCEKESLEPTTPELLSEVCGKLKGFAIQENLIYNDGNNEIETGEYFTVQVDNNVYIVTEQDYLSAVAIYEVYQENQDILFWPLDICINPIK